MKFEKQLIAIIQEDLPVTSRPYLDIARKLGVSEQTVLDTLDDLCRRGIIRRFGASLRHQRSGFSANVMVAWKVDEAHIHDVGRIMASFDEVSHCYRRNPSDRWPYNIYTMVHGTDENGCRETVRRMAEKSGIDHYDLLFSRKELKKTSMKYFSETNPC